MTTEQKIQNLAKVLVLLVVYLKPKLSQEFPGMMKLLNEVMEDER